MTRLSKSNLRRLRKRLSQRRPKHRKCLFEPLEDRRMLAGDQPLDGRRDRRRCGRNK